VNLAILQARMTSSRLPGKVLAPVLGEPMIGRQLERLRRARRIDALVVATSTDPSDDPLAAYCGGLGVEVFRGSLSDVLERFRGALATHPEAKAVVRLTADCPLADPAVIDEVIAHHHAEDADYTSNTLGERTFPHGLDTEVIRAGALVDAAERAADPYEREHVTPYIYRRPDAYRLAGVSRDPPLPHLRWTVDYPEDLAFVREIYARLYPSDPAFGSDAVAALAVNSAPSPTSGTPTSGATA
jgi:spore coat polysaccharide biosynthesis protein SpsF